MIGVATLNSWIKDLYNNYASKLQALRYSFITHDYNKLKRWDWAHSVTIIFISSYDILNKCT